MNPIATQYRTIEAGAGWSDRASRGRLRFEGRDAVPFLQALVSNDVAGLSAGRGIYTAYLTPQGRMIAGFGKGGVVYLGFRDSENKARIEIARWK